MRASLTFPATGHSSSQLRRPSAPKRSTRRTALERYATSTASLPEAPCANTSMTTFLPAPCSLPRLAEDEVEKRSCGVRPTHPAKRASKAGKRLGMLVV